MSNIIEITDFNAPELDVYARLSEGQLLNRHEPNKGIFIAESPKVIERALDFGTEPISLLLEKNHINGQARGIIERCGNIPIYTADFDILTQLTGFKLTRGALCAMRRPKPLTVAEICNNSRRIAVLENVMNPTNLGAIFRSAAALGIDGILLTPGSTNPLYRRAIRVSMGTVFQIPWAFIGDKDTTENIWPRPATLVLKELGYKLAAMALRENTVSISHPSLKEAEKLAILLGTEGEGLSDEALEECDYTVKIPMYHNVDSLNVAAASAIAFWELCK